MAQAKTDSTRTAASKASSNWLSIIDDVFPQWRDRLESGEDAVVSLETFLCDRKTCAAIQYTSASGEIIRRDIQHPEFWQNRLGLDRDADGVDHLGVDYRPYVHEDYSLLHGWSREFVVRRLDVQRWQGLYPPLAEPSPAPRKEPTPKRKRRKAKQPSGAGAPEQHDWEEGEMFAMQELTAKGNPLDKKNQTKGWKTISDLATLVRDHLKVLSKDKDYAGPDMSTTRGKASGWIKKFQRKRS
jgi:hypothetical protein